MSCMKNEGLVFLNVLSLLGSQGGPHMGCPVCGFCMGQKYHKFTVLVIHCGNIDTNQFKLLYLILHCVR